AATAQFTERAVQRAGNRSLRLHGYRGQKRADRGDQACEAFHAAEPWDSEVSGARAGASANRVIPWREVETRISRPWNSSTASRTVGDSMVVSTMRTARVPPCGAPNLPCMRWASFSVPQ